METEQRERTVGSYKFILHEDKVHGSIMICYSKVKDVEGQPYWSQIVRVYESSYSCHQYFILLRDLLFPEGGQDGL